MCSLQGVGVYWTADAVYYAPASCCEEDVQIWTFYLQMSQRHCCLLENRCRLLHPTQPASFRRIQICGGNDGQQAHEEDHLRLEDTDAGLARRYI